MNGQSKTTAEVNSAWITNIHNAIVARAFLFPELSSRSCQY